MKLNMKNTLFICKDK